MDVIQPIKIILDGFDYAIWSQEMSSFLKGRRLWRIVTGSVLAPVQQKMRLIMHIGKDLKIGRVKITKF